MKRTTEFRAMPKANCTNTAHKKWGKINGNGKTFSLAPSCVTPSSLESPPVTWTTTFPLPQLPSLRFFFWCSATLSSIFFVDFEDRVVFQMQYCWLLCLAFVAWLLDSLWQEHCCLFARFHFSSALFEFFHFYFLVSLWRFLHDYSFLFLLENLL